jgi:hypothetical protein
MWLSQAIAIKMTACRAASVLAVLAGAGRFIQTSSI